MLPLPIDQQDALLQAKCPQFQLLGQIGSMGGWEGTLTPICQTYRIRIIYFSRRFFDNYQIANPYIEIFVIDPPIGPDPRGTGEPPQHVYRLGHPPAFPALCLYDPNDDNWLPSEPIVDRIIPWIIKWLFFHELWVATGKWEGGGRHPEAQEPCLRKELNPRDRARRDRFRNAEFHRLGRKIGVFASFPLMAAASEGSFQPQFWRDWSAGIPVDIQSHPTSILLQAPRQAESSRWDWVRDIRGPSFLTSTQQEDARFSHPSPIHRSAA
jgi:hypothetical protein